MDFVHVPLWLGSERELWMVPFGLDPHKKPLLWYAGRFLS